MLQSDENLGTPLAEFNVHWRNYWLLQAFLVAMLGLGIWLLINTHIIEGSLLVIAALLLLISQTMAMFGLDRGHRTVLFEDGLIDYHAAEATSIRWSEIAWLQFIPSRLRHRGLRIGLYSGHIHFLQTGLDPLVPARSTLDIPALRMADLIDGVMQLAGPFLFKAALRSFDSGAEVDFGALHIGPLAIRVGAEELRWDTIDDIDIDGDHLILVQKNHRGIWKKIPYYSLRNPHLLVAVLEHAQGERFSLSTNIGGSRPVRRKHNRSKWLSRALIALPMILVLGWFPWDFYDWSTNANRHVASGYCCLDKGDPAKALNSFDHALQIDPSNIPARCGRGAALRRLGQNVEARIALNVCRVQAHDQKWRLFAEHELQLLE